MWAVFSVIPFVTGNDTEDVEIRKVGGKRFVTDERLVQFQRDQEVP
jgi:hypothetical protein